MNVGFAVMLSGVVCLSALALIGSFMDSVTDKKWMDWCPIIGAVFSMAILVLVFCLDSRWGFRGDHRDMVVRLTIFSERRLI